MEKWRHFRIVVLIHEVNQYNWLIPSLNVSYILNTYFVHSFFILHINLTEYKHIFCEKNVIFASFLSNSEKCYCTLAYIIQTNNIILMKLWNFLHSEMTNHLQFADLKYLEIWPFYRHIKIWTVFRTSNSDFGLFEVSDFKSGERTGLKDSDNGLLKKPDFCWSNSMRRV